MGDFFGVPQPTPEAHCFGFRRLQAALQASPSLAWSCPRYAISDGEFGDCKGTVFLIAKGRFFCNQITPKPFIPKILIRFSVIAKGRFF